MTSPPWVDYRWPGVFLLLTKMNRIIDEADLLYVESKAEWRAWLEENHAEKTGVWLVNYKKQTGSRTLSWSDAVDEALCFGWIDSTARSLDEQRYAQFFSPRKPRSTWSKINKEKVKTLIASGLMKPAGLACIKVARQNGSWTLLDSVEALKVPKDLREALIPAPKAKLFFSKLSPSAQKVLLQWLVLAKTPETRHTRIDEIIRNGTEGLMPKAFRRPGKP